MTNVEAKTERKEVQVLQKVVIEGGMHDEWRVHHILATETPIPQDTTAVTLLTYKMELVGKWTKEGMEPVAPQGKEVITPINPEVLFLFERVLERPTTVIAEDGRIFHDKTLLGEGNPNNDRLGSLLATLHRNFAGINPAVPLFGKQQDYLRQRAYHSTGYGRVTFIDTPVSITAPGEMDTILRAGRKLR